MTADVVAFLRAALDESEQRARGHHETAEKTGAEWQLRIVAPHFNNEPTLIVGSYDPRAALARVQAERTVLHDYERAWAEYAHQDGGVSPAYLSGQMTGAYSAVIALAYGHRHTIPGFDPAWAPEGVSADA